MKTFITVKDGCVDDVMQTAGDDPPGEGWINVPFNFMGSRGDKWPDWFDDTGQRISDNVLVDQGRRIDQRGCWYRKDNPGETKMIYNLDETAGDGWTREPSLENEPYQKWDGEHWVVDTERKEAAEKENAIFQIQSKIEDAERRIQRSTRAKLTGTATEEDEKYFMEINTEINLLREEIRQFV